MPVFVLLQPSMESFFISKSAFELEINRYADDRCGIMGEVHRGGGM